MELRIRWGDEGGGGPAQWVGLKALIRGLGVGGKRKQRLNGCSCGYLPLEAIHNLASEVGLKPSPGFSSSRVT